MSLKAQAEQQQVLDVFESPRAAHKPKTLIWMPSLMVSSVKKKNSLTMKTYSIFSPDHSLSGPNFHWETKCKVWGKLKGILQGFHVNFGVKAWRGLLATVNKCIPHQVNLYNHSGKELKLSKIKCKKIWEWRSKPKTPFFHLNIPSALFYVLASFQGLTQHDFINGIGNYRTQPIEAK